MIISQFGVFGDIMNMSMLVAFRRGRILGPGCRRKMLATRYQVESDDDIEVAKRSRIQSGGTQRTQGTTAQLASNSSAPPIPALVSSSRFNTGIIHYHL